MLPMIALQGMFGVFLLYTGINPSILDGIAASRKGIGLPPDRRRMKWVGLLGGSFIVLWSLAQVVMILAN